MEKIKIDELDRRTYYPMSFNEQMAWIDEEVEYLINDREKTHKQLNEIRAMGVKKLPLTGCKATAFMSK